MTSRTPTWAKGWVIHFFAVSVVAGVLTLLGLALFKSIEVAWPDIAPLVSQYTFASGTAEPEPAERLTYQLALILGPLLLLGILPLLRNLLCRSSPWLSPWTSPWGTRSIVIASVIAAGALVTYGGNGDAFFYWQGALPYYAPWVFVALCILGAELTLWLSSRQPPASEQQTERWRSLWKRSRTAILWVLGALVAVFCVGALLLRYVPATDPYTTDNHFEAVFNSSVRVALGETLLVDGIHQYGLYPEFLAPIFNALGGIRVSLFTVVMGVLQTLVHGIWLFVLLKLIRRPWLALLVFLGLHEFIQVLIPWHLTTTKEIEYIDPYFQYQPIRTLFPALAMLFMTRASAWRIMSRNTLRRLMSFALGLGMLWNLDAGLPAFGAWGLFLAYVNIIEHPGGLGRRLLKSVALGLETLAAAALAFLLFSIAIKLKSGSFPDFLMATSFQKQFYISGFFMVPMRLDHSWIALAALYLVVLSWCIGKLFEKPETGRSALAGPVFGMAVLACGLFAYYQGRSHDWNFVPVVPMGFVFVGIFADRLLAPTVIEPHLVKFWRRPAAYLLCGLVLILGSGVIWSQTKMGLFFDSIRNRVNGTHAPHPIGEAVSFLKSRVKAGETIALLSNHGGVYHAESQTRSVFSRGLIELFLKKDRDAMLEKLKTVKQVFVDQSVLEIDTPNTIKKTNLEIVKLLRAQFESVTSSPGEYLVEYRAKQ